MVKHVLLCCLHSDNRGNKSAWTLLYMKANKNFCNALQDRDKRASFAPTPKSSHKTRVHLACQMDKNKCFSYLLTAEDSVPKYNKNYDSLQKTNIFCPLCHLCITHRLVMYCMCHYLSLFLPHSLLYDTVQRRRVLCKYFGQSFMIFCQTLTAMNKYPLYYTW